MVTRNVWHDCCDMRQTKKNPAWRGFFLTGEIDQIGSILVAAGPFWPTPAT